MNIKEGQPTKAKQLKTASFSCHSTGAEEIKSGRWIALTGQPNVGKSLLFNRLTGSRVAVSNYPGTTVAVDRGQLNIGNEQYDIWDLPGMYSLLPITEEERVAKSSILRNKPDFVLHVVDARNLKRMLPLAMELSETGLKVILVINMMDEAEREGISIDLTTQSSKVGIPVVPTVAVTGKGLNQILNYRRTNHHEVIPFETAIERNMDAIQEALQQSYSVHKRSLAQLLMMEDQDTQDLVYEREPENHEEIKQIIETTRGEVKESLI